MTIEREDGKQFTVPVNVFSAEDQAFVRQTSRRLADAGHRLNDFQLASRLSYFLWSSMPDEELFQLAEQRQTREATDAGRSSRPDARRCRNRTPSSRTSPASGWGFATSARIRRRRISIRVTIGIWNSRSSMSQRRSFARSCNRI